MKGCRALAVATRWLEGRGQEREVQEEGKEGGG